MSNFDNFNIDLVKIDDIVITNAAITNSTGSSAIAHDYDFDLKFGFAHAISVPDKKIRIVFSCSINTYTGADKQAAVDGKFEIAHDFSVENLDELTQIEGDNLQIDANLITSLASIAYSTSRGIIYTKCLGTILKSLLMPVLSYQKIYDMLQPEDATVGED